MMSAIGNSRAATRLVLLVTAAVFINYIDRGNLATAAPLMQDQLRLSATQLGVLFSAFYYGYVLCMPGMGWLAERYGAKRVLGAGVAVWSLATFLTGFAGSFATLLALRVLLGIGESAAFPCASKVLAHAVEVSRLGLANGVLSFGYLVGPAVGTLLGGYLMTVFGWRPVFLVFGALSILWLLPWRKVVMGPPVSVEASGDPQPSLAQILRCRALWGAAMGHFASNYTYYFIISWLPFYLVKSRGFSIGTMVAIASWAYALNALSALLMGWAADRWIRAGRSTTLVYKGIMAANHIAAFVCMAAMVTLPAAGSIAALMVFEIVSGFSYPGLFAIPQIIAGPGATGRWVGIQNAVGNLAGFIAPTITGVLVDQTGLFDVAFALAAVVNVLGLVGWVFVLPKIVPLGWAPAAPGAGAAGAGASGDAAPLAVAPGTSAP
jgi:MFS family permease